jgi:hypothetical protein
MISLVVTLDIDYPKEITNITFPLMEKYAKNINANFKIIQERKYPNLPITLEKFQLYDLSADYEWIIFLDADVLINPNTVNFTKIIDKNVVVVSEHIDVSKLKTPQFQTKNVMGNYSISSHSPFYFLAFHNSQKAVVSPWEDPLQYKNYINKNKKSNFKQEWYLDDFLLAINIVKYNVHTLPLKNNFLHNTIAHNGSGDSIDKKVKFLKNQQFFVDLISYE